MDDWILAIETSVRQGSVALGQGGQCVGHALLAGERRNAADFLPRVDELLRAAGCKPDAIGIVAYSQGPGSFTGLRVAATIARAWLSACGARVVAVPTLDVIARNTLAVDPPPMQIAVVTDARSGRIFAGRYAREGDALTCIAPAALVDGDPWLAGLDADCTLIGDGIAKHAATIAERGLATVPAEYWRPDARTVLALGWQRAERGEFCTPSEILPAYHRPPECEEVYEQRRAAARARRGE